VNICMSFKVEPISLTIKNSYLSHTLYVRASGDRETLIIFLPTINHFVVYIGNALCLM